MIGQPSVAFVVPVYNNADTLERCLNSALRQTEVRKRILVVDHDSGDGSGELAAKLSARHPEIEVLVLKRLLKDRKSPSRPLNEGIAQILREHDGPRDRSWVFRLDADDVLAGDGVVADQLRAGGYRQAVMATLVFFDERARSAYEYGPRRSHRTLSRLPGKDLYAVAHHATAMRMDVLDDIVRSGPLYDERLETGEDLGVTCRMLRALGTDASRFAFVSSPYCYKSLAETTITGSLPLRRVWISHRALLHDYPEITRFAVIRGLAELALSRVVGESLARRSLQHLAGRNGEYSVVGFERISRRLLELAENS